jgi:hypothetical protein
MKIMLTRSVTKYDWENKKYIYLTCLGGTFGLAMSFDLYVCLKRHMM